MNSILEQMLELTSPLFAVVASGKKRAPKKSGKKRVTPKPKRATRAKPKKSTARPKPVARRPGAARKSFASSKKVPARPKPVTARSNAARKSFASSKKNLARPVAPSKPDLRKGVVPVKPEPKVVVPPPPPPKPVRPSGRAILLSPENGKYADTVHPKFRWLSVGGATRYEVIWSQDPNLINGYSIVSVATEASVPVEKPLAVGVTYYWHVRGGNEVGWGPWSAPASFSVLEEENI